ncbi:MAG: response regulator [Proteobacteria bacterium]|nr:response regulator [Pseudomonadota bacterium]
MTHELNRILLVDDDRQTRLKLSRNLESEGYTVGVAQGGRQALDMLESASFDLIILDILMPEVDGFTVLSQVKATPALREIPVVVISAVDDPDSIEKCRQLGAAEYLIKPVSAENLNACVSTVLAEK